MARVDKIEVNPHNYSDMIRKLERENPSANISPDAKKVALEKVYQGMALNPREKVGDEIIREPKDPAVLNNMEQVKLESQNNDKKVREASKKIFESFPKSIIPPSNT